MNTLTRLTYAFILTFLLSFIVAEGAEPYCIVRTYDERDGLSQSLVKQVVQDDNGVLWVATWNGLNRFDGYDFECIRPGIDDEVRRYSSRISDIKLTPGGRLWCRIDGRLVRFDVNSYEFTDSHSLLEEKFSCQLTVKGIWVSRDDELMVRLADDTYIIIPSTETPEADASISADRGGRRNKLPAGRTLGDVGPYRDEDLVMSCRDDDGTVWLITRDGDVICAPSADGPFRLVESLEVANKALRYAFTDAHGNVWLVSKAGLHRVTLGSDEYTLLRHTPSSMLRTSHLDSAGRLWMSWSDAKSLGVSDDGNPSSVRYVRPDGSLSVLPTSFGASVYSIIEVSSSEIWLGSKPDGLFRLRERPDGLGYTVQHFYHDSSRDDTPSGKSYYDGTVDSKGRLWLASMGSGVDVVDITAQSPGFVNIARREGYPREAMQVRRIIIVGDTMAVAATTGGLLTFCLPDKLSEPIDFTLHVSEPGRHASLGNIATMDVTLGPDGHLYVATESDGVVRVESPLSVAPSVGWDFMSYRSRGGFGPDVALGVQPSGLDSILLVSGSREICLLDPSTGDSRVYGASFWHRDMRFNDARPVRLTDGRWLFGLNDGAVLASMETSGDNTGVYPVMFTSVSVMGRRDSLLTPDASRIELYPGERDVTLHFAALNYADGDGLHYAFRVGDDGEWVTLGKSRAVTFAGLEPGTYEVAVRSTDIHGQWLDNARVIMLDVIPTFWETGWAKALYILIILSVCAAVIWTVVYIRRIKRQQRDTLEAHLRLLESRAAASADADNDSLPSMPAQSAGEKVSPQLSSEDRQLMDVVLAFIESRLSDSSVSVDDMAAAAAVSRSGLTRKMKSLMGVTPAEFLRETRLTRASTLLANTDRPIKEIAVDCGFSDMNYFGKCFKASRGVTPGAYRKSAELSKDC